MIRWIWLALLPFAAGAETLTIDKAVAIALENNYNIRIARNDIEAAQNTRKLKLGGVLPSARAEGGMSRSYTESQSAIIPSQTSTGVLTSGDGPTDTYTAGVSMNWTLFDGFRMFHAYSRIEHQAQLGEQSGRHQIDSSAVAVITAYYNLLAAQSMLDVAREQLTLSRTLLEKAKAKYEFGGTTKRLVLRQQVLVNADSSSVASRKLD
ncbi:MAG: hypothetical protein GF398_05805, partial [Chitinivibrionales bacterium]|nr:hypothetical protein [Chitinivibrionales bacterium]